MRLFEKITLNYKVEIRILGIPVLGYTKNAPKFQEKYIDLFPSKSISKTIQDKFFSKLPKEDFDDIYIVWNNTGESWQFLSVAREYFNKNNSKKPLIVTDKPYHVDMVKMLLPDILTVNFKIDWNERLFIEKYIKKINGHRLFIFFPMDHFIKLENKIQQGENVHFYDSIIDALGLPKTIQQNMNITFSSEVYESLIKKLEKTNLNIDNLVFISPEAKSNPTLSNKFWQNLKHSLNEKGFDCYFNIFNSNIKVKNNIDFKLSVEEALILASKAKFIIGLRSGFVEILNATNKKMFVIYTGFFKRATQEMTADKVLTGFSLNALPWNNQNNNEIIEYNAEELTEEQILENILAQVEKDYLV